MRMVQTGISRAMKTGLHQFVRKNISNRFSALAAGMGVTVVLQSSTATGLMVSSFAHHGVVTTTMALAIMLGADIGTTLVAQVLSLNIGWLSPLLLLAGVITIAGAAMGPCHAGDRTYSAGPDADINRLNTDAQRTDPTADFHHS